MKTSVKHSVKHSLQYKSRRQRHACLTNNNIHEVHVNKVIVENTYL